MKRKMRDKQTDKESKKVERYKWTERKGRELKKMHRERKKRMKFETFKKRGRTLTERRRRRKRVGKNWNKWQKEKKGKKEKKKGKTSKWTERIEKREETKKVKACKWTERKGRKTEKKTKPLQVVFDLTRVKKFDSLFCFPWKTKTQKNTFYYKFLFDLQNKGATRKSFIFLSSKPESLVNLNPWDLYCSQWISFGKSNNNF